MAVWVKNPPATQEVMWARSLGWEDSLEEEMATHSSILTWRVPWTEEPGGLQSIGSQRVGHGWVTKHARCIRLGVHPIPASLVAQMVKHLPTMQETRVRSVGREDLLEKEMATHSSILAWRIPWTEEPVGLQFMGSQRVGHNWATSLHFYTSTTSS